MCAAAPPPLTSSMYFMSSSLQYMPAVNDTVIGVVVDKSSESYRLNIGSRCVIPRKLFCDSEAFLCGDFTAPACLVCSCLANLGALSFDGATKRNKPSLAVGALVFARVEACDPDLEPEVTCKA